MYLVTGANGQLGTELKKILPHDTIYTDKDKLDIANETDVAMFVQTHKLDAIINCAAYTNVDAAEDDRHTASQINNYGPWYLARAGVNLVHISTDYVFDGNNNRPYLTTDEPNPLSVYGRTKWDGERAALEFGKNVVIIRTARLYSPYGKNFVKTMRKLGEERESIGVVADQIGSPTYAADLAAAIVKILPQMNAKNRGIYHFTNAGECSWYEFACEIMKMSGLNCNVEPIKAEDYPTKAKRPRYSVLDTGDIQRVFGIELRHWKDALRDCIGHMK